MQTPDLFAILKSTPGELEVLLDKARATSWSTFGKKIHFYTPTFLPYPTTRSYVRSSLFPSISITGNRCSLKCAHCSGKMLETMIPVDSPRTLIELCRRIRNDGGIGCLISGGCRPDGSVPLESFVQTIGKIKHETGLTIVVHTGVLGEGMAKELAECQIDAALIDIIGSDDTVQEIYQLNARVEDYEASMKALHDVGVSFVPHILVGLHYGKLRGELKALQIISKYDPAAIIFIALIPIRGTPMERITPPDPFDIARVIVAGRSLMPSVPQALGCARPTSESRKTIDVLAVRAGINAIAFPTDEAISTARSFSLEIRFSSTCCSQIHGAIEPIL